MNAMNRHSFFGRSAISAAFCFVTLTLVPTTASAQDFFSFLWGGGSRETISFSQSVAPGQVIVSFGDRKLYWVNARGQAISYPIAVPRTQSRWSGVTSVSSKRVNPGWTPTADMRRENPKLPAYVPGGHPQNPLGVRALYLGSSMYRIHGTDAPWTIGTAASKGCIRMYNEDVLDLYPRVPVGTKVTVTWKRYTS
jgi:lipoprotein-anchoring transpeptidase ErfK/SrfK